MADGQTPQPAPKKGGAGKIVLIILVVALIIGILSTLVCCGGCVYMFRSAVGNHPLLRKNRAKIESNPAVQAQFGSDVKVGSGTSLEQNGPVTTVVAPISGSKGSGTVRIGGQQVGDDWTNDWSVHSIEITSDSGEKLRVRR